MLVWGPGVRGDRGSGCSSGKASSLSPAACHLPRCSRGDLRSADRQHQHRLAPCAAFWVPPALLSGTLLSNKIPRSVIHTLKFEKPGRG